jgi:hypothetical protein
MVSIAVAVVQRYFAFMTAGDSGVADLFHDDAHLVGLGTIVRGRPAIDEFYATSIEAARPMPNILGPWLENDGRVAVELSIKLENAPDLHVVDLFVVADGKIRSLTYFVADHP